jgi:heme exporter protein D
LRQIVATNPITSWRRHHAEVELRRRENWWTGVRGWVAIGISILALAISLTELLTGARRSSLSGLTRAQAMERLKNGKAAFQSTAP